MRVSLGVDFPIWKGTFKLSNGREKLCLHIIHFEILVFIHRSTSVNIIFKISRPRCLLVNIFLLFSSAFLQYELLGVHAHNKMLKGCMAGKSLGILVLNMGVGRIFSGGGVSRGFSQNYFLGGPKAVKFVFYPSKLKKQPFLLINSKSRGGKALPPLLMS